MSGLKCSEFQLQREREQKLQLVQNVSKLQAEINGLQKLVQEMLNKASKGLRDTFAQEVKQAQGWVERLKLPDTHSLGMESDLSSLQSAESQLKQKVAEARRQQEALSVAFSQKAGEMGRRTAQHLAELEQQLVGCRELVQLWWGEEQIQTWENTLRKAKQLLAQEEYHPLEKLIKEMAQELTQKMEASARREDKHQKRLYLLKALRQVCAEMSFEEVSGPHYKKDGYRGNDIIFTVDTLNRGKLAFTLSLEKISSFSEIADDRCFEDFGKLSEHLKDRFGVHTQFGPPGEERPPEGKTNDEKSLPVSNKPMTSRAG